MNRMTGLSEGILMTRNISDAESCCAGNTDDQDVRPTDSYLNVFKASKLTIPKLKAPLVQGNHSLGPCKDRILRAFL